MIHPRDWIQCRPEGIYCLPGEFYIDPLNTVDMAIITHGHADHARSGHSNVLTTAETAAIMQIRYNAAEETQFQLLKYNEPVTHHQVKIYLLPAGHILGSAQVVLEYQGSRLIISGDYKRVFDPTCASFVVETCDVFITEATFGLPVFQHPAIESELQKLLTSMQENPTRCHLVGAYSLGKCQRLIKMLRIMGYQEPIYIHGAMLKLCELYQQCDVDLGDIRHASVLEQHDSAGKLVLCPPGVLHDRWSRRFAEPLIANASGWMRIRARAKQKGVELPLVISDHADWNELTENLQEVKAEEIWVTHGREEALVYYAFQHGLKAMALSLLGYDEEED